MKKWNTQPQNEMEQTAYTTLCLMKWLCKDGKLPKVQYNSMIQKCSEFIDTSDFYMFEVFFTYLAVA